MFWLLILGIVGVSFAVAMAEDPYDFEEFATPFFGTIGGLLVVAALCALAIGVCSGTSRKGGVVDDVAKGIGQERIEPAAKKPQGREAEAPYQDPTEAFGFGEVDFGQEAAEDGLFGGER